MIEVHIGKDYVDSAQACDILNTRSKYGTGVFIDLERVLTYQSEAVKAMRPLKIQFDELAGSNKYNFRSTKDKLDILLKRFKVAPEYLIVHGKYSVDKNVVASLLQNANVSDDAKEFLRVLQELSVQSYMYSSLNSFRNLPMLDNVSHDGHRVVLARPTWNVLKTGRISASEPSFQNINKKMIDIITWMPGQIYIEADSGQIEPRITYSHFIKDPVIKKLIEDYGDAYYGLLQYVTATSEELKSWYQDISLVHKKEITDEMKNQRKTLKTLSLSTNYGGEEYARSVDIGPAFIARIKNHPLRKKLQVEAANRVKEGYDYCEAALGTKIYPESNQKYTKGSTGWQGHLERCFINNPVQATAAELMNISVKTAHNLIFSKTDRNPATDIVGYVHDCGKFYVHENDAELIEPLKECMSYQVYDEEGNPWIPIGCDLKINGVEQT